MGSGCFSPSGAVERHFPALREEGFGVGALVSRFYGVLLWAPSCQGIWAVLASPVLVSLRKLGYRSHEAGRNKVASWVCCPKERLEREENENPLDWAKLGQ